MAAPPNDYQHPQCYARALAGCSEQISREHPFSEGVLKLIYRRFGQVSETVDGTNLSFQKPGVTKKLTIGRLAYPILCETHNSLLSPFDAAGQDMFVAMDRLNESVADPQLSLVTQHVDGDRLERWFLKALCGGLYSGIVRLPPGVSTKDVCPPSSWLQPLYKGVDFPRGLGLYYVYKEQDAVIITDHRIFNFEVLLTEGSVAVRGFRLQYFGFQFMLLMRDFTEDDPPRFDLAAYRPAGFKETGTGARIEFDWKHRPESPEVDVLCVGPPVAS